ncbi:heme o synthase [Sphingosinicella microcystinivorans]|uniref:Protoheme IX farnesyltransferase n=1 Tax=Sphingosinicella microcystinivorans TaxID=335406 RepID=A0AAD1D496_SPHMI|nr:heme o synthase [Sphingosinicella microcystinivorans]RKS90571.1 protoheme IX farnesyltransferase [Sphingosinicella microcystinivorans]BBE33486.1 protoheme IX farnesyltransferase [Sphingosinicella microcystinivorans]
MASVPAVSVTPVSDFADWRDYFALLKPRVMTLVVFTGLCGLLAAPGHIHPVIGFTAVLCIAVAAGASGALNMWYEADLDARMKRTANRPIPAGRIDPASAFGFAVSLAIGAVAVMALAVNLAAAALLTISILFYVFVYTVWLKRRTPQNIVIGGAAGAFPPVIGWAAVTGDVTALPVLLFALIFLWTPPHFWSLALFVRGDYANAGVPMLPVTHGARVTRNQILAYTPLLIGVSLVPWAMRLTGAIYGVTAAVLGAVFMALAIAVFRNDATDPAAMRPERRLFAFSVLYLFVMFGALVADRWLLA